jgi:uncharacterized protein (TIGR00255 family)
VAEKTGPVASMTGFARQEGGDGTLTWMWEIKSVNGRGLDLRCRLPAGYEALDPVVRAAAQEHCSRGNLQANLTVNRAAVPVKLRVNRDLLEQALGLIRELDAEIEAAPPRLDGLLAIRGVLEAAEEEDTKEQRDTREAAMEEDLILALEGLSAMRRAEGQRLHTVVTEHLAEIEDLVAAAAETAAAQPEALRERLHAQVAELLEASPALPEDRLVQEAALLITKADVREELDRLRAHVDAARELLAQGGAVGRRLDFLCQEFNREANTLCAKSSDVALTRIGLDLKTAIDRLREQVQNIE